MAKKRAERVRFSDEIRRAVLSCGLTRYRVAKETGISEATLSRFVTGSRGLPMRTLDRLAEYLDLHVSVGPNAPQARTNDGEHHS